MGTEVRSEQQPPTRSAPAAPARRWAVTEDADAVRALLWGAVGPAEVEELDGRLSALPAAHAPVELDLTGVTDLDAGALAWLADWHERFPMIVVVTPDGRLHRRLTQPGAPALRLTLV